MSETWPTRGVKHPYQKLRYSVAHYNAKPICFREKLISYSGNNKHSVPLYNLEEKSQLLNEIPEAAPCFYQQQVADFLTAAGQDDLVDAGLAPNDYLR